MVSQSLDAHSSYQYKFLKCYIHYSVEIPWMTRLIDENDSIMCTEYGASDKDKKGLDIYLCAW